MKIGILLCDDFYPEAIEQFGHHDDAFKNIFNSDTEIKYQTWRCHVGDFPEQVDECDAWVISGSKWSVYEQIPWMKKLIYFIQQLNNAEKALVGICFGHQLIHEALGGKVNKSPRGWGLGLYPIEVKHNYQNLKTGEYLNLIAMHQDQVERIAPEFKSVAGSDFCPHAITIKDSHILTLQSHPEFKANFFIQLCERVRENAGNEMVNQAQQQVTEEGEGDRKRMTQTIQQFVYSHKSNDIKAKLQ